MAEELSVTEEIIAEIVRKAQIEAYKTAIAICDRELLWGSVPALRIAALVRGLEA
jgi:hypothetical protein